MWSIFKGIIPAADGEEATAESEKKNNSPYPQLTAEEIRQRRIANISTKSTPYNATTNFSLMDTTTSTTTKTNDVEVVMTNDDNTNLKDDVSPITEKSFETNLMNTPIKSMYKLPNYPTNEQNDTSPNRKLALTALSPPLPSPLKKTLSCGSPLSVEKRHIVTMNMIFEHVLQITLKSDTDTATHNLKYIKPLSANISNDYYISHVMVSELICTRLTTGVESNGAIGYLLDCYKRLSIKIKEHMSSDRVLKELEVCSKEIISFICSSINVPEIFGTNSENSIKDFFQVICNDSTQWFELPLKKIADEIDEELFHFTDALISLSYSQLDLQPITGFPMQNVRPHSILDTTLLSSSVNSILNLIRSDKRYCKDIVKTSHFNMNPLKLTSTTSFPDHVIQHMANNPIFIETNGVAGAAIENHTLLGRLLRYSPCVRDPMVMELLKDSAKISGTIVHNNIANIRTRVLAVHRDFVEIVMNLLKVGGNSKESVMNWLLLAIQLNDDVKKDHYLPLTSSTQGFALNLGAVFLKLCQPFLIDEEKYKKIDWGFISNSAIYPKDELKLMSIENSSSNINDSKVNSDNGDINKEYTFITQSFFMCWKSLDIGMVQQFNKYYENLRGLNHFHAGLETNEPRSIHYLVQKICYDSSLMIPQLLTDALLFVSIACTSLLNQLVDNNKKVSINNGTEQWRISIDSLTSNQLNLLSVIPQHMINDIMSIVLTIARVEPSVLSTQSLSGLLSLVVYFVRRPWVVSSAHLRAKLGLVLFQVFLPHSDRGKEDMWSHAAPVNGPHTGLLESHMEGQQFLAPALLLLYGDVEKTGHYEKIANRRSIMVVLKHLWVLPSHRQAFRGIAEGGSSDLSEFISFANGLMNETNGLVAQTMDALADIKKTQVLRQTIEWNNLSQEEKNTENDKYSENERIAKGAAGLCLETLSFLNCLVSDEIIRQPFLLDEILPRLVSMLLSVLSKIVGSKSLEIKVDNMDSYNFNPKVMLQYICSVMTHFSTSDIFCNAVANDGFYNEGAPLQKAINTVLKLQLLSVIDINKLKEMLILVQLKFEQCQDIESLTSNAPEEFLDSLLLTLMRDPVLLPSGHVLDRSTISQHLLNDEKDPFNRQHLTLNMLVPAVELKKRIDNWLVEKLGNK